MASTSIYRAGDATAGSGYSQKWTWSGWVKRSGLGTEQGIFSNERTDNHINSRFKLRFIASDVITWECKDSGGSDDSSLVTNAVFRDTSGWCHICFVYDTDNGTAADRLILYVNGVRQTFDSENQASSGFGTLWSSSMVHQIGRYDDNSGNAKYFKGFMSHIHLSYGYALAPTIFGETDSTTGEWKIKTSPSVTYGSQGYFILKDGNGLTDQSGEGNDFTLAGGTLSDMQECPDNIFATFNSLVSMNAQEYVNCAGSVTTSNSGTSGGYSNLGMNKGKYYAEFKLTDFNTNRCIIGVTSNPSQDDNDNKYPGQKAWSYSYSAEAGKKYNDNSAVTYGDTYTTNSIIGVALDLDNLKIYFSKDGVWQDSGDPESGSTGTGAAYTVTAPASTQTGFYFFCVGDESGSYYVTVKANFGNGYFGTSAISSEGTTASNIGKFEFNVPAGYTALSTKGLNE